MLNNPFVRRSDGIVPPASNTEQPSNGKNNSAQEAIDRYQRMTREITADRVQLKHDALAFHSGGTE